MSHEQDTKPGSSLSPYRRNWVWFGFQMLARVVFGLWFRARTRGIENLPTRGGALLLINHQSFLDPLVMGTWLSLPISYLARDNLFRVPVVGWILRHTYVMPINRAGGSSAVIRKTIERLQQGYLIGIFPEGTRSTDGQLGRLKPGFLAIVRRADAPVIPVGISGTGRALGRGSWFPKPYRVRVVIGKPLSPEEMSSLSKKGHEAEMLQLVGDRISECHRAAADWPVAGT